MAFDTGLDADALVNPMRALNVTKSKDKPLPSVPDLRDDQVEELDSSHAIEEKEQLRRRKAEKEDEREQESEDGLQSPGASVFPPPTPASRPHTLRRATDPITNVHNSNPLTHLRPAAPVMGRSRNRSPYSRSHHRSRSSNSSLGLPMARSYSSPLSDLSPLPELHPLPTQSTMQQTRPDSPKTNPFVRRASPRRSLEEPFMFQSELGTPSVPTIEEHAELSLPSPTPTIPEDGILSASPQPLQSAFSRSRRRPSSPLYSFIQPARVGSPGHRVLHTSASTPILSQDNAQGSTFNNSSTPSAAVSPATKYNEAFPVSQAPSTATAALSSASSMYSLSMSSTAYSGSMPSTPTSIRSRSPSVSSLGTIPDSPDAEEEAMERERIDTQERLERLEKLHKITGSRESDELGRRTLGGGKERKRWSVCGAERRGDLEMETIWED